MHVPSASFACLLSLLALFGCAASTGDAPSPTPIVADSPAAAACLADMHSKCEPTLDACAADDACSAFTESCLNGAGAIGTLNCMSDPQGDTETNLFMCLVTVSPACDEARQGGSAEDGGLHGD